MIMFKATLPTLLALVFALATSDDGTCNGSACTRGDTTYTALQLGSKLTSPNGDVSFRMQADGNLVLYCSNGNAIWSSGTAGTTVEEGLSFQADGNLALYSTGGGGLWSSESSRVVNKGATLKVQNDGNVVLYTAESVAVWKTGTSGKCDVDVDGGWTGWSDWSGCSASCGNGNQTRTRSCTNPTPAYNGDDCEGEETETQLCKIVGCCTDVECFQGDEAFQLLARGTQLTSANGRYELKMLTSGNLVLYCDGKTWPGIWASSTNGNKLSKGLWFQTTSNLVIYNVDMKGIWFSGTWNTDGNRLKVQDDGNVVLYNAESEIVWSTGTAGEC